MSEEEERAEYPRRIPALLEGLLREEPVIALEGPRSVGKSTVLRALAAHHGVSVLDLDNERVCQAVLADPALVLTGSRPICIDEYQRVPMVLDALKVSLNAETTPGMAVLTGSTQFDALTPGTQSLAGRLHIVQILPLSQGEILGVKENFLECALNDPSSIVAGPPATMDRARYIERIVAGGLPIAVNRRSTASRARWFDDYVRLVIDRDIAGLARVERQARLPKLLGRVAGQTAQVLNLSKAAKSVGMGRGTAESYTRLLENAFLVRRLPAWGTTLRALSDVSS